MSLSVIPTPDSLTYVDYGHDRCHFHINCRPVSAVFCISRACRMCEILEAISLVANNS